MTARAMIALALLIGGCGDNLHVDDVFEATSGSRLKIEWHLYEDGTRQAETAVFYDINVHARCTPQLWIDGAIRCVPIAEDAIYIDATCDNVVGRGRAIEKPTHFIGYDALAGTSLPARLYRAGPMATPVAQFYEKREGICRGPFQNPSDLTYYELVDEIAGSDLVEIRDEETGVGRLGIQIRSTADGVSLPIGLRDRDLDAKCAPMPREDGSFQCAPIDTAVATVFHDRVCEEFAITVSDAVAVPTLARVADPSGCARFHAVGAELSGPVFRREGEMCIRMVAVPGRRVFALAAELDLPVLGRTIEDVSRRRLQRIVLGEGDLRFVADRLYDTATRADCQRRTIGDAVRCLPAVVADASVLFTSSCAVEVQVAEIPQRTCEPIGFAVATTADGMAIHAIGDRAATALYQFTGGTCQPYAGAPGNVVRMLGPPIAPETFSRAVSYGER